MIAQTVTLEQKSAILSACRPLIITHVNLFSVARRLLDAGL